MVRGFPIGHNKEYYLERLVKTAFTDIFLERVCEVYELKNKNEAISILRSNNLWEIFDFMADYYFKKYGVKGNELTPEEKAKVVNREYGRQWREKNKKYVEETMRPREKKQSIKNYYEKKGYENLIEGLKKRAEALGVKILDSKKFNKNLLDKIKKLNVERIIIIYK